MGREYLYKDIMQQRSRCEKNETFLGLRLIFPNLSTVTNRRRHPTTSAERNGRHVCPAAAAKEEPNYKPLKDNMRQSECWSARLVRQLLLGLLRASKGAPNCLTDVLKPEFLTLPQWRRAYSQATDGVRPRPLGSFLEHRAILGSIVVKYKDPNLTLLSLFTVRRLCFFLTFTRFCVHLMSYLVRFDLRWAPRTGSGIAENRPDVHLKRSGALESLYGMCCGNTKAD